MEVSIIIPVYNVSAFIEKCIKSVIHQNFKNFECIIINDGTKDNSIELVEAIIKGDKRFKVFHQKNQGQGMARNLGLKHAKGKYICFIDADDFVQPNYLMLMYHEIEKQKADVVCCGFHIITKEHHTEHIVSLESSSNVESLKHLLNGSDWGSVFNRMFRSHLIIDLKFKKGIAQDKPFIFEMFVEKSISKVIHINQCLYNYIIRKQSATNSMSLRKIDDLFENMISYPITLIRESEYFGKCENELEYYKLMSYLYVLSNIAKNSNEFIADSRYFINQFTKTYHLKFFTSIKLIFGSQMSFSKKTISMVQYLLTNLKGTGLRLYHLIYRFRNQSLI
jgi:glycosyltransferase involved in cell wall biosynthesis